MADVVAIIPARSGSKGVPDKNIKLLAGKPLLAYSIETARKSKLIGRVIVSTDSKAYAEIAKRYGAEVPFLRPKEIAGDTSTDFDFVKHLLDWLDQNGETIPDYLVHLRPTTPLRAPHIVDNAIKEFIKNPEATSLRSAHEMPETAYKQFELESGYFKTLCNGSFDLDAANKSRQAFPKTYSPNGYVDILRTSFVLENHLLHGNRVMGLITPLSTEVDTEDDFKFLEWEINQNNRLPSNLLPEK